MTCYYTYKKEITGALNQTVEVLGYYDPNDGGGGQFYWTGSTAADNHGTIISTGLTSGRWERVLNTSVINVRWFGAILGAIDTFPPGGGGPITITDVTPYVHLARDVAKNGTLFFPRGTYPGAFEFFRSHGQINLLGDGEGTVLKSNHTNDVHGSPNPVLRLGEGRYSTFLASVTNLWIDGRYRDPVSGNDIMFSDGIMFDEPTATPENAGKWIFEKLIISNCVRGVYKPKGNYGNTFSNCVFASNTFGYYALGFYVPMPHPTPAKEMHAGADRFLGGNIRYNEKAGIYVGNVGEEGYGQLIIDGSIMEYNDGFGIFMQFSSTARKMATPAIEIRNVWTEENATAPSVTIGLTAYTPYDYYFEQVRSVIISGGMLRKLSAKSSSIMLQNCRTDSTPIVVDSTSVVTADFLRLTGYPDEAIFVNSIAYDDTFEYGNYAAAGSSVWGPVRTAVLTGNNTTQISQRYNGSSYTFTKLPSGPSFSTTQVTAGVLSNRCARLTFSNSNMPIEVVDVNNSILLTDTAPKYYVWSIHALYCYQGGKSMYGYIGTAAGSPVTRILGGVILKPGQWSCSYGVKRLTGDGANPPRIYLTFGTSTQGIVLIADYQIQKFDNFYDASAFLNSRAFGEGNEACGFS